MDNGIKINVYINKNIKNINIKKIVSRIFWFIIIVSTIVAMFNIINEIKTEVNFYKMYKFQPIFQNLFGKTIIILIGILILSILSFVIAIIKNLHLVIIYIAINIIWKKHKKERLTKIDFENKDIYYREIINKYSPGILKYIDDFSIDENTIIATLMSLELKNKIEIKDKINILSTDIENLYDNEKYIYNCIKNNTIDEINLLEYKCHIINDCKKDELLIEKEDIKKKRKQKIIKYIIIYFVIIVTFIVNTIGLENQQSLSVIQTIILIILGIMLFVFPIYGKTNIIAYAVINAIDPFVRTKKANEINEKVEGLKKYIEEYSLLEEKDKNSLEIWQEYLIYTVMFGKNSNISDQYSEILNMKK